MSSTHCRALEFPPASDQHRFSKPSQGLRKPFVPEGILQGQRQDHAFVQASSDVPDAVSQSCRTDARIRELALGGDPHGGTRPGQDRRRCTQKGDGPARASLFDSGRIPACQRDCTARGPSHPSERNAYVPGSSPASTTPMSGSHHAG